MTEKKPATKRAPRKARAKAAEPAPPQVPASKPVRLEVRLNGKIRYSDTVYDPTFDITDAGLTVSATLQPRLVDAPQLAPPTVFVDQNDVRDGEDFIPRVHSGRRDLPQQDPPHSEWPTGTPQAEEVAQDTEVQQEEAQAIADSEDGLDESGDD